jgi:hypothetical protein
MKRSLSICLAVAITASSAFSQGTGSLGALARPTVEPYSFNLIGAGARSLGMGGAFIGVSDDVTAISWNPAGLVTVEEPVISVSYRSFGAGGQYSFGGLGTVAPARDFDHNATFGGISNASFAAPVRIKGHEFIGSVGLTRHSDEYEAVGIDLQFDSVLFVTTNNQTFLDTLSIFESQYSEKKGSISSVDFGWGTRFYNNISIGMSVNVYMGQTQRRTDVRDQADDATFLDPFGQSSDLVSTVSLIDTNKWSGFNFTLAGKIDGERLDAGLVIRTPFTLKSNTTRSLFQVLYRNDLPSDDGSDTTYFIDMQVQYKMPLMIGAGVAYKLNENTTLALDADFRNFGSASAEIRDSLIINPDGSNESYTTEDTTINWKSVFSVRGGVEKIMNSKYGQIPVRAGASFVPFPNPIQTFDLTTLTIGEKTPIQYNFSLGTGIWWSQIKLDLAYTYSMSTVDDGIGENKNRNHVFSLGFTGVF